MINSRQCRNLAAGPRAGRSSALLILSALLALPALVQAQFTFTTNNGAITITGYNTAAGLNAVIPAATNGYPVTSIGDYAFGGATSVTIPGSVTNIADDAFEYSYSLTNIAVATANPAYSSQGGVLFDKAQATLLQFPSGLGGSYIITNSVTSIGNYAFDDSGITSVTIGNSVTSIGNQAFFGCTRLTSVTIPGSVTSMGKNAFEQCGLTSMTIGNGVTSIGDYAFVLCSGLTSVTFPNSVTNIGTNAFYGCSLTSVTVPASVTSIADGAFGDCTSLTNIAVDVANPAYRSLGGVLFDKAQVTLLEFPGGLGGNYTITNSVTSIGDDAFYYCTSLTSVTIPDSVTSIGNSAFGNCFSLTSVTIGNSVTSIGDDAFTETALTSVTIPNSVTNIGRFAFANTLLTNVTIPDSVTSIGDFAFAGTGLTTAYFLGNEPPDDGTFFNGDPATVYYLSGTTGWGSTFGGVPAVLWNPQATMPGFIGGQFGFNLTGPTNAVIVVEACTNLSHPVWLPVSTNTLSGSGTSVFSDPQSSVYPMRYYRFASP